MCSSASSPSSSTASPSPPARASASSCAWSSACSPRRCSPSPRPSCTSSSAARPPPRLPPPAPVALAPVLLTPRPTSPIAARMVPQTVRLTPAPPMLLTAARAPGTRVALTRNARSGPDGLAPGTPAAHPMPAIDVSELLRPGLLQGVTIVRAGAAPSGDAQQALGDAVGDACSSLGAEVRNFRLTANGSLALEDAAIEHEVDRVLLDGSPGLAVLVVDAASAFAHALTHARERG